MKFVHYDPLKKPYIEHFSWISIFTELDFDLPKNSNVLIVEDVITTGKSALECSEIVKKSHSNLVGFSCIIDRSTNKLLIKDKIISQVKFNIETYTENSIPEELKKIKAVKPGSRYLSKWKKKED